MPKRLERKESVQSVDSVSSRLRKRSKTIEKEIVEEKKVVEKDAVVNIVKVKETIETLKKRGIVKLFPVQQNTYQPLLDGQDMIAKDRTGSGKTLGFLLPTMDRLRLAGQLDNTKRGRFPKVIVLLPTRELAIQVHKEFEAMKNKVNEYEAVAVYGGTEIYDQKDKLRKGCDVIIGTPGRCIDLINRHNLILNDIQAFILDEADRMLDMGFSEDIEKVIEQVYEQQDTKTVEQKKFQTILFSATIPRWVHDISRKYLSKDRQFIDMIKINGNQTSETIQHLAINCPYHQRIQVIGDVVLIYSGKHCRTIIFTETKKEANEIMMSSSIKQETQVLHGDIPQKQREITFQGFKEGKFKCLIATNVVARGLDIPEVDLILQLDPPKEIDSYIHRAGRTARAGKNGACITFYNNKQVGLLDRIEKKCKIEFKRIGTPQPKDIIKASARDVIQGMEAVPKDVCSIFIDNAKELLLTMSPEDALAKALAYISGHTEKLKQRSILCAFEGYVTFQLKTKVELRSQGYVWNFLRNNFTQEIVNSVKGMKMLADRMGVVFDLVEEHESVLQDFADANTNKDIVLTKCVELPALEEDQNVQQIQGFSYNSRGNHYQQQRQNAGYSNNNRKQGGYNQQQTGHNQSQQKNNGRGKKELEVFIGGIPNSVQSDDLIQMFNKANIQFDRFNYLQDKGVCFAACQTQAMMDEALTFNEYKLQGRKLRVSPANKK